MKPTAVGLIDSARVRNDSYWRHMFKDDAAACPDAGDDGDNGKQTGKAMRWDERGWGFIKPDDGGEVLFCHYSVIEDGNALVEGAEVQFVKEFDDRKGKDKATKVTGGTTELEGGGGGGGGFGGGGQGGGGGSRRRAPATIAAVAPVSTIAERAAAERAAELAAAALLAEEEAEGAHKQQAQKTKASKKDKAKQAGASEARAPVESASAAASGSAEPDNEVLARCWRRLVTRTSWVPLPLPPPTRRCVWPWRPRSTRA